MPSIHHLLTLLLALAALPAGCGPERHALPPRERPLPTSPPVLPPPLTAIQKPSVRCGGALLITEIHLDPASVSDRLGEFVELYNHSDEPVSLTGWRLSDTESDTHVIRPSRPLIIEPGGFAVLGAERDPALNGGLDVDYQYSDFRLSNRADRVLLQDPCGTPIFDLRYPARRLPRARAGRSLEQTRNPRAGPPSRWRRARHRLPSGDRATPGFAPWSRSRPMKSRSPPER